MGVELELTVLLAFAILGQSSFARFEVETPPARRIFKWSMMSVVTVLLFRIVGHWALLFPATMAVVGTTFHILWCRRNGIDAWRATPRRRYYDLRGWQWPYGESASR